MEENIIEEENSVQQSENNLSYNHDASNEYLINKENHAHELSLDKQDKDFQLEMQKRQFDHENRIKDKELGWAGKIWGEGENSSRNIAAIICFLLLMGASIVSVVIYCYNQDKELLTSIWKTVMYFVALALGYIFGKNN